MNQIMDFKEERGQIFKQLSAGQLSTFEAGQLLDSLYLKYSEVFPDNPLNNNTSDTKSNI